MSKEKYTLGQLEGKALDSVNEIHIAIQSGVGYMGKKQMRHAINVIDSLIFIVRGDKRDLQNLPPKDALGKFSKAVTAFVRAYSAVEKASHDGIVRPALKRQLLTRLIAARAIVSNNPNFSPTVTSADDTISRAKEALEEAKRLLRK